MRLILDAGPIIALAKISALHVLPRLFEEIVVPSVVMREVAPRSEKRPGVEIRKAAWVRVARVSSARSQMIEQTFDIDPGEAAAIVVAEEDPEVSVLLLDDRAGLAAARARGLAVLRTGALLVHAVEEKVLTAAEVTTCLATLRAEHYLSAQAERDILKLLAARR
jgi:predicted nucleic acid-binding protein